MRRRDPRAANRLPHPLKTGFTLIELLVVIAIIALLASILFPVFGRARENARRASCQSNLRQMGTAVLQYQQDYDEKYPWSFVALTNSPPPEGGYWSGTATNGYWFWPQILYPYHKSEQVFACPSMSLYKTGAARLYRGHYGANRHLMPLATDSTSSILLSNPMSLSNVPSPSTVYMFMDSGNYYANSTSATTASGSNVYIPGTGNLPGVGGSITDTNLKNDFENGRHFQGVNVAYADGHVKWIQSEKLYTEAKKLYVPSSCGTVGGCTQHYLGQWNPQNTF